MRRTHTGGFPIGFRTGGGQWQRDLGTLVNWTRDHGFSFVDTGPLSPDQLRLIRDGDLQFGTMDLPEPWTQLASPDAAKRKDAAQAYAAHVRSAVAEGVSTFFVVVLAEDFAGDRADSFRFAVDGYGQLSEQIADVGARVAIEGWPGPSPHFPALACTPESYRALFGEVGGRVLGVNYDPSHLIRMGIDPVRFLHEFVDRVHHVHAKDTEIFDEALYECGNLQGSILQKPHGSGAHVWRYAVPGHGQARWGKILGILTEAGYRGLVSIELEDENYSSSEESYQRGLLVSGDFLETV